MLFLEFGDIFYYENKEYVLLANIDNIIYAAMIISPPQSRSVVAARDVSIRQVGVADTVAKPLFCFVELRTLGYENHIASLARTDEQKDEGLCLHAEEDHLCHEDMVELKSEIVNGNLPAALKEHFKTMDIAPRK